jgi:hypothetical protein
LGLTCTAENKKTEKEEERFNSEHGILQFSLSL